MISIFSNSLKSFLKGFNTGGVNFPHSQMKQDPPIYHDLSVALEDVLSGCMKKIRITRKRPSPAGNSLIDEEKILEIDVKKGWKAGTKITFPREGDKFLSDNIPADIVFVIKDRTHRYFKRDGCDIRLKVHVGLKDALCGLSNFQIPTLENQMIPLPINQVIKPDTQKRVPGRGLPDNKNPSKRGDLIVEFEIVFPDSVSDAAKRALRQSLPDVTPSY